MTFRYMMWDRAHSQFEHVNIKKLSEWLEEAGKLEVQGESRVCCPDVF